MKTYEIKQGPPRPKPEDYFEFCQDEWAKLLKSSPEEHVVQSFLEQNPVFIPGAWTPRTKAGSPLHYAVVSQPVLPGLKSKKPDFMWIAKHSLTWYPTLIEIEKPSKRIFKSNGVPCAKFTQARNQLAEWRTWFSRPENVHQFIESYGIPEDFRCYRQMKLHMILIYGRRTEFEDSPELSQQRGSLLTGDDEELMSFDRLKRDKDLSDAITVRCISHGRYEALAVPPLFSLSPLDAERLLAIDGLETALAKTPLISKERRDFLVSRIPYWKDWAKNGSKSGLKSVADVE